MTIKRPKPLGSVDSLYVKGFGSDDPLVKAATEKILFDQLAEQITNREDLDVILSKISDENQRRLVLEQLKPRLNLVYEEVQDGQGHDVREVRTGEEGGGEEECSRPGAISEC